MRSKLLHLLASELLAMQMCRGTHLPPLLLPHEHRGRSAVGDVGQGTFTLWVHEPHDRLEVGSLGSDVAVGESPGRGV